ncbi:MAG TPA: DUF402 domain-containing protein [bacterium]|nr:DUF402 domain-containing protein [bacterium]
MSIWYHAPPRRVSDRAGTPPTEGKEFGGWNPLGMQVLEIKRTLAGETKTYACRAAEMTADRAVLLYTLERPGTVGGLTLPAGTLTVAYYWTDRPYNVYHWIAPDGTTLAYYFNLSGPPRIEHARLEWEDLEVDVLVTPDARARVLDEDRVPASAADRLPEIAAARDRVLREYREVARSVEAASRTLRTTHGGAPASAPKPS